MGRRLNISQPAVINTELTPLTESFFIEADNTTEQWYYDNTMKYAPDREVIPLRLTPKITAVDASEGKSYNPSFYTVSWYVNEYNGSIWEEKLVTAQEGTNTPYSISGTSLIVRIAHILPYYQACS